MIYLNIEAETFAELAQKAMTALGVTLQPMPTPQPAPETAAEEKSKRTRKAAVPTPAAIVVQPATPKAETPKAETPKAETPKAETQTEEPKQEEAKPVTAEEAKKAMLAYISANGQEAAIKLLKDKFGVGTFKEIKPEQYADVLKATSVE